MRGIEAVLANKKKSPITRVEPSTLPVSRFSACVGFYRRALGLMLRRQVAGEAEFDVAGSTFTLRRAAASEAPGVARTIRVATKDLERVRTSVEASGAAFAEGPERRSEESGEVLRAVVADPDWNRIVLTQPA